MTEAEVQIERAKRGMISEDQRARARAVPIEEEVRRRGIKLKRESTWEWVAACLICHDGDDRFRLNTKKQLWRCRWCGHGGDVISLVMLADGLSFRDAVEKLAGEAISQPAKPFSPPVTGRKPSEPNNNTRNPALAIWADSHRDPLDTPVALYLARRRVTLPPGCTCIRFHPKCPFGKDADGRIIFTPAMLALVTSIADNRPQAIHRTALDLHGNAIEIGGRKRMTLGPIAGGAIKLTPDECVTTALGIGEGLESAASLAQLPEWLGAPVWSVLNKHGIAGFPVLPGIETVAVAVDPDAPGQEAARAVAQRWRQAGREVLLFIPNREGDDLNDIARRRVA